MALTISIPPFQDLTLSWLKVCGGEVYKSLSISTDSGLRKDVLNSGLVHGRCWFLVFFESLEAPLRDGVFCSSVN